MDREESFWISRIRKGESHYFKPLYDRHHQKIFALCYRFMRNMEDAEDMVQEIFMRMLKKINSFDGRSSFATWFHRLAVNALINAEKKRARASSPVSPPAHEPSAPHTDSSIGLALEQAIATLPAGFRQVFILHDQEGFDHTEIAGILGCSVANSKSQLCRARSALRQKLTGLLGGIHG